MKSLNRNFQMERYGLFRFKLILAFIATIIIFLILLSHVISKTTTEINFHNLPLSAISTTEQTSIIPNNLIRAKSKLKNTETCVYIDSCDVSCNGGSLEATIRSINALSQEQHSCSSQKTIKLSIQGTTFTNNTVSSGWLQGLTRSVSKLNMASLNLKQIGGFLFSGEPFTTNLLELTFNNIPVKILTKSMFMGSSLSTLEIYYDSMSNGINIEQDILGEASSGITSIALKYCLTDGEALKNLTGRGSILTTLKILDISYNLISKLPKQAFLKAPSLQTIYLISSGINEIELGAFDGLHEIIQLYINNNNLKTLSDGMFNDLTGLRSLYISGNPWNCNCDLQWFKDFLNIKQVLDYKWCKIDSGWVTFDEVDFCPAEMSTTLASSITPIETTSTEAITSNTSTETSLSTSTQTASTSNTTNAESFLYEKIWCRNLLMYSPEVKESTTNIIWYESMFKRRQVKYSFSELEATTTFRLDISTIVKEKDYLIWTDVKNRSDYGCVFNISQSILLDLQYERTYTICLASNDTVDKYALIADDCTAITTPPDWNHRAWFLNYQKTTIIVATVITFISTIGITAAVVYYIVKYNPELIKGNKRILIVKTGSYSPKNVPVKMSSKRDNKKLSLCTDYEGYLSPRIKNWIGNQENTKELGSIIDELENNAEDSTIYEPPPLPPNHPMKRRDSGRPYFHCNM